MSGVDVVLEMRVDDCRVKVGCLGFIIVNVSVDQNEFLFECQCQMGKIGQ